MTSELTNFREAIRQLGSNEEERAAVLGITTRQLRSWRNSGKFPSILTRLVYIPELARAIARDAEQAAQHKASS